MRPSDNAILRALPAPALDTIKSRIVAITLEQEQVLAENGAPIGTVVFPTDGVVSVVAELAGGERIESALIGSGGLLGASVAFGAKLHVITAFVQMPGHAYTMSATDFAELARKNDAFRELVFRHEQFLLAQAQQSVACNARHHISQRLATWLLRATEAAWRSTLQMTQDFLAQMLGVQRASVSLVAARFQEDGLMRYRRGNIEILNELKLRQAACECSEMVRLQYKRLLADGSSRTTVES